MKKHITPRTYLIIYAILMLLALISLGTAFIPFGAFGVFLALFIAALKAILIILYFMHVKENTPLIWLGAAAGFLWLLIMFILTLMDYMNRFPPPPMS